MALAAKHDKSGASSKAFPGSKCRICKVKQVQLGHYYCLGCSYKKGICSMCGKRILDTRMYKQTKA